MIDVISLAETWGTWAGLIGQAVLRGYLGFITVAAIGLSVLVLVARQAGAGQSFRIGGSILSYLGMTSLIIVLFQPELFKLGNVAGIAVTGADIQAMAAVENGGIIQNAAQLATARGISEPTPKVPPMVFHIIRGVSGIALAAGRTLNEDVTRPGATLYPLSTFANYRLPNKIIVDIQNWTANCVVPAKSLLSGSGVAYTDEDIRPAPGTALWAVMAGMNKPIGKGVLNLIILVENCADVGANIYSAATNAINSDVTPLGTPFAVLWQTEIGIEPVVAVEHFVEIEVDRAQGPDVPGPSLAGKYALAQGAASVTKGLKKLANGNPFGALGQLIAGAGLDTADEALSGLKRIIAFGMFWNHAFPVFLGVAQTVVLTMLSVAVLWSVASPGHQIRPIGVWIVAVAIVYSGPLIFGLIGLMSNLYGNTNLSFETQNINVWVGHHIGIILIQSSGPLIFLLLATAIAGASFGAARIARGV